MGNNGKHEMVKCTESNKKESLIMAKTDFVLFMAVVLMQSGVPHVQLGEHSKLH